MVPDHDYKDLGQIHRIDHISANTWSYDSKFCVRTAQILQFKNLLTCQQNVNKFVDMILTRTVIAVYLYH